MSSGSLVLDPNTAKISAMNLVVASIIKALDAKHPGMMQEIQQKLEEVIVLENSFNSRASTVQKLVFDLARDMTT
jgi:hypothetical protein